MSFATPSLLIVLGAAAAAPVIGMRLRKLRLPAVVLELALGVALGPQGLAWVSLDASINALAGMGMAMLFFLAGCEIDLPAIHGQPLRSALAGWLLSLGAGLGLAWLGLQQGWLSGRTPALVAGIAFSTTALGILVPMLRDAEALDTLFGRRVMAAGVVGELGPILLMSVLLSERASAGQQSLLVLAFLLIVFLLAWALARRVAIPRYLHALQRTLTQASQLPVRITMFLVCLLAWLAEEFGLDLALGTLAAGMIIRLLTHDAKTHLLQEKLDSIGFGFLVPVFFVCSGLKLDVAAVFGSAQGLRLTGLYLLGLMLAHLPILLLALWQMRGREALGLSLLSATTLSLIVAMTEIADRSGHMKASESGPLVMAGVLSVVLLPQLAKVALAPWLKRPANSAPNAAPHASPYTDQDGL
ncbi:cation:proton antiporter [Roseateles koreensis]|uniref:Cation:proton antiporter n=1 Tax=Roseateles koreensis TaxID=2987526 RepID=A0ABT5KQ68_9BURK|nr:cation:proton antiporter [Roseateles koreensis]MDC8785044.1 cation:proton antiporter [Roseateles koreensis]